MRGSGLWNEVLDLLFSDIFNSLKMMKEKKGNMTKMRGRNQPKFLKEMILVYAVIVRNQAGVNKISNYLITFNVS